MNALIAISEDFKLIYCCRLQELLPYKLVRFSYLEGEKLWEQRIPNFGTIF